MATNPTRTQKENEAGQLRIGLTHISTFRPNLAGTVGPNVLPVMNKLKAKIRDMTSERFSLDVDWVDTTTELIHLENEFTDNLTGDTGGNYADVVTRTFEQHLAWLDGHLQNN